MFRHNTWQDPGQDPISNMKAINLWSLLVSKYIYS